MPLWALPLCPTYGFAISIIFRICFQNKIYFLNNYIRSIYGVEITADDVSNFRILNLYGNEIENKYSHELNKILANQVQKEKLLNRSESEIFKNPIKIALNKMVK